MEIDDEKTKNEIVTVMSFQWSLIAVSWYFMFVRRARLLIQLSFVVKYLEWKTKIEITSLSSLDCLLKIKQPVFVRNCAESTSTKIEREIFEFQHFAKEKTLTSLIIYDQAGKNTFFSMTCRRQEEEDKIITSSAIILKFENEKIQMRCARSEADKKKHFRWTRTGLISV